MKRKTETKKVVAVQEPEVPVLEKPRQWEFFFRCQRSPVLRSQLLTALMSGTVLDVERLPTQVLLDVVLLSTASRFQHQAEIVSDYTALLEHVKQEWARPDWTCRVFDQLHSRWANSIATHGTQDFGELEERYIPDMVGRYLESEVPEYFVQEFETEKDLAKYRRAA